MLIVMKSPFTRQTLFEFCVSIAILVGIGLMSWRSVMVSEEADEWVNHSYALLSEVQIMLRFAYNADANTRGYMITGDESYRKASDAACAEFTKHIPKLVSLIQDNPHQAERAAQVQDSLKAAFSELDQMMEARRSSALDPERSSQLLQESKNRMDHLQLLLTTMESEEDGLLVKRLEEARRSSERTVVTVTAVTALLILLFVVLFYNYEKRRQKAEGEVRVSASLLAERTKELERANSAKDRFLSSMSHELRTPLNSIIGFTGTLLMQLPGPLNAEQNKQLNFVKTSARHLLSLINDILDLARIESGKVELKPEVMSCNSVIDEVINSLNPLAQQKGLTLGVKGLEENLEIVTDRRALSQILINLINNSIKFTEKGNIDVDVERASNGSELLRINVCDTGIGIKPEDQMKLFRAFERIGNQSPEEGSGLGLHLSQRLAQLMGGYIEFHSEFGQGSRFTVVLPQGKKGG
jgi:signal transduction histidine kinase